jgi:hypothetical protein
VLDILVINNGVFFVHWKWLTPATFSAMLQIAGPKKDRIGEHKIVLRPIYCSELWSCEYVLEIRFFSFVLI